MHKCANSVYNHSREMKFGSRGDVEDYNHSGVGSVEISNSVAVQSNICNCNTTVFMAFVRFLPRTVMLME